MLRKLGVILAMCSGIVLLLGACGTASSASSTGENVVHMNDMQFVQASATIKKGESLILVADTSTPHIIANGTWEQSKGGQISGNSSQTIGPFTTAGTFKLYCTIHSGMNLTVRVVE